MSLVVVVMALIIMAVLEVALVEAVQGVMPLEDLQMALLP